MSKYNHKNRRKYNLKVHIVLVTKYRRNILNNIISNSLKDCVYTIATEHNFNIVAMETDINHVHILLEYDTIYSVADIVKIIKQITTFRLWLEHEDFLSECYWNRHILWSDGYFACSIGEVSSKIIQQYIGN